MLKLRLRTKFLLSLLILSATVTAATLWLVGRTLRMQVQTQLADDLQNSVTVFHVFQRQREVGLASSAEIVANLPNLKALMTTHDAATIQDASTDMWLLIPSDVFVLADPIGGVIVAALPFVEILNFAKSKDMSPNVNRAPNSGRVGRRSEACRRASNSLGLNGLVT